MNTTILGLLAAVAATIQSTLQQGHMLTDWKTWILPAALAALPSTTPLPITIDHPPADHQRRHWCEQCGRGGDKSRTRDWQQPDLCGSDCR